MEPSFPLSSITVTVSSLCPGDVGLGRHFSSTEFHKPCLLQFHNVTSVISTSCVQLKFEEPGGNGARMQVQVVVK